MRFALLALFSILTLAASCRCTTHCWEQSEGMEFALTPTATTSLALTNAHECSDLASAPPPFDRSLWASTCNAHFAQMVMLESCAPSATRFCAEQCSQDPDCATNGRQTLERVCAEKSFEAFRALVPYCAGFELSNTVLVPKDGGQPACGSD